MEDSEEQGVLEDVDMLQTKEEHAKNLNILKDQKDKRIKYVLQSQRNSVSPLSCSSPEARVSWCFG